MAVYGMGRRRVIALLALTSILLITIDQRGSAVIDRSRGLFSLILEPFDAASRAVSRPVINAWRGITNYDDLVRENERLRAEIDNQRGAEIEYRAGILEYQELLTLNQLLGASAFPSQTAQVQGASPSNFQYTVEIDKGTVDGIAIGMPVVNGGGLVGKITAVFPNSSIVLLIVDPDFSIGAKVLTEAPRQPSSGAPTIGQGPSSGGGVAAPSTATSTTTTEPPSSTSSTIDLVEGPFDEIEGPASSAPTTTSPETAAVPLVTTTTTTPPEVIRETGTLSGQGVGKPLVLRFVDDSSTQGRVQVGSTVQTAGGATSIAPAGLPIGEVIGIRQQSGTRAELVEVLSSAGDLSKLNFVRVLLYVPNQSGG